MTNRGNILRTLLVLCVCTLTIYSYAQVDISCIKNNPQYWWAEGRGVTIDEADKDALSQIIQQISINISTDTKDVYNVSENKDGFDKVNRNISEIVSATSFASLQNVKMMVLRPEPDALVFRWVSKDEVKKMFDLRKKKIKNFVEAGKVAEQRLQIDDALRNYYWALILAQSLQDEIECDFNGQKFSCVAYLPQKIKSVISHIDTEMTECIEEDNRYYMTMNFKYNGRDVSSLQLRYFDGQSYVGPLVVRNGIGMLDMISKPSDDKLKLSYEYMFRNDAVNLDPELKSMFTAGHIPTVNNSVATISMKEGGTKKGFCKAEINGTDVMSVRAETQTANIAPEPVVDRERIELETIDDNAYRHVLKVVEDAIRFRKPENAYECFTADGYEMFNTLLKETGKVTLVGKEQNYEIIQANDQVLARYCRVKVKFSRGKTFMENIVFRFDDKTKKIKSLAFGLTKKAEDDIFNASARWTNLSRFVILQFLEDYQTAYSLRRLDYLSQVFSDKAIIITGTVLKTVENQEDFYDRNMIRLGGPEKVKYTRKTKQEYLETLKKQFDSREYIHLTFEDNISRVINAPRLPMGTAFGIQINQIYSSPVYSDKGYLTLVLDTSGEYPIIYVRLWQPDKIEFIELDNFISKFKF